MWRNLKEQWSIDLCIFINNNHKQKFTIQTCILSFYLRFKLTFLLNWTLHFVCECFLFLIKFNEVHIMSSSLDKIISRVAAQEEREKRTEFYALEIEITSARYTFNIQLQYLLLWKLDFSFCAALVVVLYCICIRKSRCLMMFLLLSHSTISYYRETFDFNWNMEYWMRRGRMMVGVHALSHIVNPIWIINRFPHRFFLSSSFFFLFHFLDLLISRFNDFFVSNWFFYIFFSLR